MAQSGLEKVMATYFSGIEKYNNESVEQGGPAYPPQGVGSADP